jgi:RNA polymerase sigma-B factor
MEPEEEAKIEEIVERTRRSTGRDDGAVLAAFNRLRQDTPNLVRAGDASALRDHLVLQHAPLVEHCARNYVASGEPIDDLLQEGYVGLIKAVDRFDPSKGVRFSTYACHLITGEIRHYLRDLGKLIHEPGWHSELRSKIARTGDSLSQKLSRPASPEEIAESLNVRAESVHEVLRNTQVLAVDSLDAERGEDGEGEEVKKIDLPAAGRATESQVEERVLLGGALPQLKDLEKRAIHGFFFEEKSKTQVAADLGISVNYAAYLIKQGTMHLREIIEGGALESTASPSEARAAYLLSLLRKPLGTVAAASRKKARKPLEGAPDLVEFAAFISILDDELRRCHRFGQDVGVLWMHAPAWEKESARWSTAEAGRAFAKLQDRARSAVRGDDRVGTVPPHSLPGLNFLVVLPHTGATGRIVQSRLSGALPDAFPGADKIKWKSALAVLPRDGLNGDALFEALAQRIGPGEVEETS